MCVLLMFPRLILTNLTLSPSTRFCVRKDEVIRTGHLFHQILRLLLFLTL